MDRIEVAHEGEDQEVTRHEFPEEPVFVTGPGGTPVGRAHTFRRRLGVVTCVVEMFDEIAPREVEPVVDLDENGVIRVVHLPAADEPLPAQEGDALREDPPEASTEPVYVEDLLAHETVETPDEE